jgi:hypothetical protein
VPTSLGEVVAVEKAARQAANKSTAIVFQNIQKPALVTGFSQVYIPDVEDPNGRSGKPPKGDKLQVRSEEALRELARLLTTPLDLSAVKDYANCHARADVVVGGKVLLPSVPVTYLMSLEHQLTEIVGFFRALQVNDPAKEWVWDAGDQSFRTREPEKRLSEEKGQKALVLLEPTQYQAGQAIPVPDNKREGVWEITYFSGAVERQRKTELVERGEVLLAAVKQARERANHHATEPVSVGLPVFGFLLGGAMPVQST